MQLKKTALLSTAISAMFMASNAGAVFTIDLGNGDKIEFGGYLKADYRYVDGEVAYRNFWIGNNPGIIPGGASQTRFNVRESRINTRYTHGDISAFLELDFYGSDGNEVIVSGFDDRIRHFFVTYKGWLFGQTWSTFQPLAAIPESLDFGAGHVGKVFIRQPMVRYTYKGFAVALENPETVGGQGNTNDSIPDLVMRYIHQGDWGQVGIGGLVRQVDSEGIDETAFAVNVHGKINTFGKDDFRFQITGGEPGRYAGTGLTPDVVNGELEESVTWEVAYRHFWTDKLRSTGFYANGQTDIGDLDRTHWGINLMTDIAPRLTVGAEFGNYEVGDANADSNYFQISVQFKL